MAEPEKKRDSEIDRKEEYEEEEENGHSQRSNTSLAELNMLLVLLSLFYFSTDDCIEHEESEQIIRDKVAVAKTCISSSRLQTKRRVIHEPKLGKRSFSSRSQTTIRDSRHGRKM